VSRFSRPSFTAPKIPSPPPAVGRVNTLVSQAKALVNSVVRLPTFSLAAFLSVNPAVAQARAQLAAQKENLLKAKIRARALIPVPPVPDLGVTPAQLAAYRAEAEGLLRQAESKVDEFGRPR
jgi:hypothetical protein